MENIPLAPPRSPVRAPLLRVMTQNCFGLPVRQKNRRFLELAGCIRDLRPDLVFLQEVLFRDDETLFRIDGYERAYLRGPVFLAGGLLILARTRIAATRFHPFTEQGRWWDLQITDRILGKGWLEADLPDWGLTAVNTHLVSLYERDADTADHRQGSQVEQLMRRLETMDGVILGGDMNFCERSPFYERLQRWGEDISKDGGTSYPAQKEKIDHLFLRHTTYRGSGSTSIRHPLLPHGNGMIEVSDHYGILATLRVEAT
jgi:endonuclease/exonuclease/phosphatase (EEP) superfamily protein YafD